MVERLFKVGDKVTMVPGNDYFAQAGGQDGIVIHVDPYDTLLPYLVHWGPTPPEGLSGYWYDERNIKLLSPVCNKEAKRFLRR
jgi:hypothetical protein